MERPNLAGDAKGKDTSGYNRKVESTDAPERGGLPRISDEAGNGGGAKGQAIGIGSGQPAMGRNPIVNGRRQPSCDGTSRMNRLDR
jgi:hypothetical protein